MQKEFDQMIEWEQNKINAAQERLRAIEAMRASVPRHGESDQ